MDKNNEEVFISFARSIRSIGQLSTIYQVNKLSYLWAITTTTLGSALIIIFYFNLLCFKYWLFLSLLYLIILGLPLLRVFFIKRQLNKIKIPPNKVPKISEKGVSQNPPPANYYKKAS